MATGVKKVRSTRFPFFSFSEKSNNLDEFVLVLRRQLLYTYSGIREIAMLVEVIEKTKFNFTIINLNVFSFGT
jgi:IS4 transposase